ncbi:MAG TPA: hypothetical protein VK907_14025 [Phnomibacter sp.]|nr:hypothetical protein [Phnomibacter sp.]
MTEWGLSKKAFWDVRIEEINFEKHARYVMEKVFNNGSWSDQVATMRYYGLERIKEEVVEIEYLRKPVLAFLSAFLNIPKTDLKCYTKHQFQSIAWPY